MSRSLILITLFADPVKTEIPLHYGGYINVILYTLRRLTAVKLQSAVYPAFMIFLVMLVPVLQLMLSLWSFPIRFLPWLWFLVYYWFGQNICLFVCFCFLSLKYILCLSLHTSFFSFSYFQCLCSTVQCDVYIVSDNFQL